LLERYGVRVITTERPGYGLSDPQPERKIEDWATDVEALADYLSISRFHVAGGSGGGPYAFACAVRLPERVISVALVGSAVPPDMPQFSKGMASGNRIIFFLAKHAPFLLKIIFKNYAHAVIKHPEKFMQKVRSQFCEWDRRVINQSNGRYVEKELLLHLREAFRQGFEGAYRDTLLVSQSWRLDLKEITVPVFLWHGESDTLMPIAPAKEFARLIPNCESYFVSGAGHLLLESEDIGEKIVARLLSANA